MNAGMIANRIAEDLAFLWMCSPLYVLGMWIAGDMDKRARRFFNRLPCPDYTPEAPTLPPQIIVHLALSDRMDKRAKATPEELEALKLAITRARDRMAVHDLIRDVGGC